MSNKSDATVLLEIKNTLKVTMHELSRQVRFSIDPFLETDTVGANTYCSQPCGQGLSIFFELCVTVAGPANPQTGFIVNVVDIDKMVRKWVVPVFSSKVRESFRQSRHIGLCVLAELLEQCVRIINDKFDNGQVIQMSLGLNPYRSLGIITGDKMLYYSEKFEFAAMHKLWNPDFSEQQNMLTFGKCANPNGHGHNYILEVKVRIPRTGEYKVGLFEENVSRFIEQLDHKNLNADVSYFKTHNPTVENIAVFAWESLFGRFDSAELAEVTVWETQKTSCTYRG